MNIEILLLILGMTAVTYIPRAIPAVLIDKLKFGRKFEKFLRLIPYTAMSALIFPGVFTTDPDRLYIGIAGALTAGVLAWFRKPVIICVLAAVGVNMVLYAVLP
ncbi:MAG: AzlD domain-containing protein [Oscillospiraceae bacterium]